MNVIYQFQDVSRTVRCLIRLREDAKLVLVDDVAVSRCQKATAGWVEWRVPPSPMAHAYCSLVCGAKARGREESARRDVPRGALIISTRHPSGPMCRNNEIYSVDFQTINGRDDKGDRCDAVCFHCVYNSFCVETIVDRKILLIKVFCGFYVMFCLFIFIIP